jgi:glycosyltransferase involved in cell wall biosynthesis
MNPRSVLIIVENSTVPFDRRVWYEATSLRDAGWQVTIICPAGADSNSEEVGLVWPGLGELVDGITIYRFPLVFAEEGTLAFIREYFLAFKHISMLSWKVWRNHRFDIIHICNPPDIFFPIGLFYRILGSKYIFDHHDLFPEMVEWRYRTVSGRILYYASRIFEYLSLRCANVVLSTNESYSQIAKNRGKVEQSKVIIVRNGPKSTEFNPTDPVPELRNNFPHMVCFVGLMGVDDGVTELMDIIYQVIIGHNRKDILFTLVGDGPILPLAEEKVREWGIAEHVQMPGLIKNDVLLRQYLASADILVSPEPLTPMNAISTFIKIGEYMAMSKPIIAFDLIESRFTAQGAAHYVSDGDIEGFAKAIIDLIDDPERRRRMGELGRKRIVDLLSWEQQKGNLLKAYSIALGYGELGILR